MTASKYQQKLDELNLGEGKLRKWKPKPGENNIRIIPAFDPNKTGDPDWFVEYKAVYDIGKNKRVIVPRAQFGDVNCPYQLHIDALSRRTDPVSQAEAAALKQKPNVAIFVIDRSAEHLGPQVWYTTKNNLRMILAICVDPEYGDVSFAYPDSQGKGALDLKIVLTPAEQTKNGVAAYSIAAKRQSTPLGTAEQVSAWCSENLFEKYRVGKPSDAAWIVAVLNGTDEEFIKQQMAARDAGIAAASSSNVAPWDAEPSSPSNYAFPVGVLENSSFWLNSTNGVIKVKAVDIAKMVEAGQDPTVMDSVRQDLGWKTASAYGFAVILPPPAPAAPPSPPAPPAQPSPPAAQEQQPAAPASAPAQPAQAQTGTPPSTMDALKAQMEALQKKLAMQHPGAAASIMDQVQK